MVFRSRSAVFTEAINYLIGQNLSNNINILRCIRHSFARHYGRRNLTLQEDGVAFETVFGGKAQHVLKNQRATKRSLFDSGTHKHGGEL